MDNREPAIPLISLTDISKSFGISGEVLHDFSLNVNSGEILSLCGPSGIGKSTILRLIAGLIKPESGTVRVDGVPVADTPDKLSLVHQNYSQALFPWLNVFSNVMLPLANKELKLTKIEKREVSLAALQQVGLESYAKSFPRELSGGMQQRVVLARALVCSPKILLLDEPLSSLDTFTRRQLQDLILKIALEQKLTVLLVTHDPEEAIYMSDRIVVIGDQPAQRISEHEVSLARPRDQISTRSDKNFIQLRNILFSELSQKNV